MTDKKMGMEEMQFPINRDPFRGKPANPAYMTELSRKLRLNMTACEDLLWDKLAKKQLAGLRFRRQHVIGRYIVDFFCFSRGLVVEVEGSIHNTQRDYDKQRFDLLRALGYSVLRIKNHEIKNDMEKVLAKIKRKALISPRP